ncbi:hypothetical protein BDZ94DRAFT_1246787 [Collybia nuda]|uniref:Uncharacterized protein n=1 Tax=Collybia nuda TaxID=64659 RepID=A0A9P5YGW7_9AGAR|nr:hypothetical protein BDZ94DRAFT_1246787 [Collybia nuda]
MGSVFPPCLAKSSITMLLVHNLSLYVSIFFSMFDIFPICFLHPRIEFCKMKFVFYTC